MSRGRSFINSTIERYFSALNVKLMFVVFIAAIIAVITFWGMVIFEDYVANKFFLSDIAKKKVVDTRYKELQAYIKENSVKGTDNQKLQKWLDKRRYTQLLVWDNRRDVFSGGWIVNYGDEKDDQNIDTTVQENKQEIIINKKNNTKRVGSKDFIEDIYNRYVTFDDGKYYVYINVNKEKYWYKVMGIATLSISFLVFMLIIMVYNGMVLNRVKKLSGEVSRISEGNLDGEIYKGKMDEIGTLAASVDSMRNSIVETMRSEKAAWNSNTALITAMSHDIRTPLTSLVGYLDIIEGGKYKSEEELIHYIKSSREKAIQLKDLSDKLFNYFLFFGNASQDKNLENMDAGILFSQILMEHVTEIVSKELEVDLDFDILEGVTAAVEVSAIRRLFDNLFSNILKYASKDFPVKVMGEATNNEIRIILSNHITEEAKKVESTKIGVKTCRKICQDMGGDFLVTDRDKIYTTEVIFPVVGTEEEGNVNKGYSENQRNA